MKHIILSLTVFVSLSGQAQVGIGTTNPNSNAILDLSSNNKALLLPRVADTSLVQSPAAGMVVYNQQSQSPNYHNGTRWNTIDNAAAMYGTMTYTVTGTTTGGIPFDNGVLMAVDFNNYSYTTGYTPGGGGSGQGTVQKKDSVTIFKEFDGNSIPFKRIQLSGLNIPIIEINYHLPNGTKYYSIKLTDARVTSQQNYFSELTGKLTERYGLSAARVGYKDWLNNKSFSINNATSEVGVY